MSGNGACHHPDEADAEDHQHHSNRPARRGNRGNIPVSYGCGRHDRPPDTVHKRIDIIFQVGNRYSRKKDKDPHSSERFDQSVRMQNGVKGRVFQQAEEVDNPEEPHQSRKLKGGIQRNGSNKVKRIALNKIYFVLRQKKAGKDVRQQNNPDGVIEKSKAGFIKDGGSDQKISTIRMDS
jgi:hypothetical protein